MKIGLLLLGLSLTLSAFSHAGPVGGGFHGGGFHSGFVGRRVVNRGGFQARLVAPRNGQEFSMGNGIRRGFADRRFFRRNRAVVVQQFGWPVYWYPYDDSLDYSYLEPDSQPDYQYWDNSSAYQQEQPTNQAVPQKPVILVINTGNSRPTDSSGPTDLRGVMGPNGDGRYANNGYNYNAGLGQQRAVGQDPKNNTATGPMTPGDPVVPQATPAPQTNTKTAMQPGPGPFGKFIVLSYLKDRGKDVIAIKNIETNDVQRITSQPNIDRLRIVEIHPNADLRQFEAIISNGSDQGPVRFQF